MNYERLSWAEIKQKYPHQNVGLKNVIYNGTSIDSAIVAFTDRETDYNELILMAMEGKIELRYTTLDEDQIKYNGSEL